MKYKFWPLGHLNERIKMYSLHTRISPSAFGLFIVLFVLAPPAPAKGNAQSEELLTQDYTYLVADGSETNILHQSSDTLFFYSGHINENIHQLGETKCFKILSIRSEGGITFLRLKNLPDPNPRYRRNYSSKPTFSEWGIKTINKDKLDFVYWASDTTIAGLDTKRISPDSLKQVFPVTLYSTSKMKEFKKMKPITTIGDVEKIVRAYVIALSKQKAHLTEGDQSHNYLLAWLPGDLLTKVCLAEGYNPLGAGDITNRMTKNYREHFDSLFTRLEAKYLQDNGQNRPSPNSKTDKAKAPQVPVPDN